MKKISVEESFSVIGGVVVGESLLQSSMRTPESEW